jgi:hypothetical protein
VGDILSAIGPGQTLTRLALSGQLALGADHLTRLVTLAGQLAELELHRVVVPMRLFSFLPGLQLLRKLVVDRVCFCPQPDGGPWPEHWELLDGLSSLTGLVSLDLALDNKGLNSQAAEAVGHLTALTRLSMRVEGQGGSDEGHLLPLQQLQVLEGLKVADAVAQHLPALRLINLRGRQISVAERRQEGSLIPI